MPQIEADAPKVLWAIDFQFDSTVDGKAIKIASMLDEHTRLSLMNIVERSITAERLTVELDKAFALWEGPPLVLRMDNGPEFISHVLQKFCGNRIGISHIPSGTPWNNGHIESFNNRLRKECLNRNHWTSLVEARVVIEDFKDDHNNRHRHSSLGYLTLGKPHGAAGISCSTRFPTCPEALLAGRERILIEWFFREKAVNTPKTFTRADIDEYERVYAIPGGMRSMLGYYRAVQEDIEQNHELMNQRIEVPVLALGGDAGSAPDLHDRMLPLAREVHGGVIANSGHYIPEEQPTALAEQITSFVHSLSTP